MIPLDCCTSSLCEILYSADFIAAGVPAGTDSPRKTRRMELLCIVFSLPAQYLGVAKGLYQFYNRCNTGSTTTYGCLCTLATVVDLSRGPARGDAHVTNARTSKSGWRFRSTTFCFQDLES